MISGPKGMRWPTVYILSMAVLIVGMLLIVSMIHMFQKGKTFDNNVAMGETMRLAQAVPYRHDHMSWFAHHPKKWILYRNACAAFSHFHRMARRNTMLTKHSLN